MENRAALDQLKNFKNAMNDFVLDKEIQHIAKDFFLRDNASKRYLYGLNSHSLNLSKRIEVRGFVDDFYEGKLWHGKPVFRGEDIPTDSLVVNCTFSISPISLSKRIRKLFPTGHLEYGQLLSIYPEKMPIPEFIDNQQKDLKNNWHHYKKVFSWLQDEVSRKTFIDIIRYRLSGDLRNMLSYRVRPLDQYFESFLNIPSGSIFVDGGGFDGDTAEIFCTRYPDYKQVFLFEPSTSNIKRAKERLKKQRDVIYIKKALSDKREELIFQPDQGMKSSITKSGNTSVSATTIDEEITCPVSFIKLDLEGWDLKAIKGAQKHILNDHPTLAIAVYHETSHIYSIFEYIINIRSDYLVYLRHYTEGDSETIMYFIPDTAQT